MSYECEQPGYFYILPPSCANELPIKRGEDLDSNHTILLPRVFIGVPLTKKIHSIMDSRRGLSHPDFHVTKLKSINDAKMWFDKNF